MTVELSTFIHQTVLFTLIRLDEFQADGDSRDPPCDTLYDVFANM